MASEHTAKAFDSDLQELTRLVAEMGGLAERMITESVDALIRRDVALGKRVVADHLARQVGVEPRECVDGALDGFVDHAPQEQGVVLEGMQLPVECRACCDCHHVLPVSRTGR